MFRPMVRLILDGRYWPKHVVFLLLNTIINPYYHSFGFVTYVYLTIKAVFISVVQFTFGKEKHRYPFGKLIITFLP